MGPLVPDIIGNELNFVVAIFVGIAFGFILEQAGFSTSKKLVGLFYGYDFTVLRVFFTAGVVAMIGVVAFDHFGILDISLIYINPTFLWSAIVGGIIMGLGFVIGGFCPGTSVCAAAIGKIDAMVFIIGSFLGVYIFAEGYPLFEGLYKASPWGNVRMFDTFNMSQSLFAFLLVLMAVGSFWMVTFVEKKVNGFMNPEFKSKNLYVGLTIIAFIIGISLFFMPTRKDTIKTLAQDTEYINQLDVKSMDTDELAFWLMDKDPKLQIIDLRTPKEYSNLSLPKSINLTIDNLFEKEAYKILSLKGKKNLFIANDEVDAKKAAIIAKELGYKEVFYLKGGLKQFKSQVLNYQPVVQFANQKAIDRDRFLREASVVIPELIKEYKSKQSTSDTKKTKRILGGC